MKTLSWTTTRCHAMIENSNGLSILCVRVALETFQILLSLDFDLEGIDLEGMEQADTLALDTSASDTTVIDEETLVSDDDVEQPSDSDEVDTKLNLAKAYIELGDKDGARSIIDEVARDGTPDQKAEAQRLIDQLS